MTFRALLPFALRALAALLCAGALVACESSDDGGGDTSGTTSGSTSGSTSGVVPSDDRQHPSGGQSWTYLVYLLGDTDLEPFALQDLEEMARVGSGDNFNLIVLVDRSPEYTSDGVGNLPDFTTAKLLKVESGSFTELDDLGEVNMGDPQVLADFIAYGVKNYPADRVAIDFWDHGGAWPGFGPDDSHNDVLTLPEIAQGLQDGLTRSGLKEFSLIGFDACLMATFEVAMSIRPMGEYLLASEELEPGHGWNYESLSVLRDDPSTDPVTLGRAITAGFQAQAQANGEENGITLSLTDLYALEGIESATKLVNEALAADAAGVSAALANARQSVIEYGGSPDPENATHMVDLGDLLNRAASANPILNAARDRFNAALSKAILHNVTGSLRRGSTGLSIYWPSSSKHYNAEYDNIPSVEIWRNTIKGKGEAGQGIAEGQRPVFTNPNHAAGIEIIGDRTVQVSGQLADASLSSIAYATLSYAVVEGDTFYVIGDVGADITNTGLVSASWSADIFTVSQGGQTSYAYLTITYEDGQLVASIPFLYVSPSGAESTALLVLGTNQSGDVISSTYYVQSGPGYGQLTPTPGSRLYPLVLAITGNTSDWIRTPGDGVDPTQPIQYGFSGLDNGTAVYLELNAYDYGDNSDYVFFSGQL